jgi:hypothetical protein
VLETTWYVWMMILFAVGGFAVSSGVVIYRGALAAAVDRRLARNAGILAFIALGGWAAVSAWLADAGYYLAQDSGSVPLIPIVFALVMAGLIWASRLSIVARAFGSSGSLVRLTLPHTLRILGGVFLVVMAQDALPPIFALPAGLGDIAIGVAAPFVAWRLARGEGVRRAVWFNILGLVDLVVAISIGFLAAAGPFQILDVVPSTAALAMLPLVLIPTVAVPVAITLHVASLRRLRAPASQGSRSSSRLEARST